MKTSWIEELRRHQMRKYLVDKTKLNGFEIAIVGMDCRMPGADNISEFWNNIVEGKDTISFFSDQEMEESGISKTVYSQENYVKAKGIINNCDKFDNIFFNYTPEEVSFMDPQLRVIHECVYHGLEDAGYSPFNYQGEIGLFLGNFTNYSWLNTLSSVGNNAVQRLLLGSLNDINNFATRVAYALNLKGPAISVETACSTSLVAIHLACQSLLSGDCDMAVAGGVSITVPIKEGYLYEDGMIYSKDGHCHAFSNDADGSVFSDGAGVVVLKMFDKAIADNDDIYAVIKGSAINNDGCDKAGFTAPSINGQARAIRNAIYAAKVRPEEIEYIETHGTATQIGDTIEVEALKKAFNVDKCGYCALGSVKSNIGHTNNAAGLAGIIKIALSLKSKIIPPSINFSEPNEKIDFKNSPFYVNTEAKEWKKYGNSRVAGVSAFGIGGTNAHIILEEAPEFTVNEEENDINCILLSAKSKKSLDKMKNQITEYICSSEDVSVQDIAYTLNRRDGNYKYRMFYLGDTLDKNGGFLKKDNHSVSEYTAKNNQKLVFVFTGIGSEYMGMMKDLYQKQNVFRENINKCMKILEEITDINFIDILYGEEKYRSSEIQILIFILEYALAKTLEFYGIKPDISIGYSFGEYVAACLSGVFTLYDALYIIVHRGRLMKKLKGTAMLSVPLNEDNIKEFIDSKIHLSIINEETCTVSGIVEDLDNLESTLRNKRLICSKVPAVAGHCKILKCIENDFRKILEKVTFNKCSGKYYSAILNKVVTADEISSPDYWINHMLNPVRFSDSVKSIIDNYGNCTFIEVGPGANLTTLIKRFSFFKKDCVTAINMTRNKSTKQDDYYYLLYKICLLWCNGHDINKEALLVNNRKNYVRLPLYPFSGETFKIVANMNSENKGVNHEISTEKGPISKWLYSLNWGKQQFVDVNINPAEKYIIFCDVSGYGIKTAEKIGSDKVYIVRGGNKFSKCSNIEYVIDISSEEDYNRLIVEIIKENEVYNVLNFMCLDNNGGSDDSLNPSFYSLLYFVKNFQKKNSKRKNTLKICSVVTDCYSICGTENIVPYNAGVVGLSIVISQEYPAIKTKVVEFDSNSDLRKIPLIVLAESSVYNEKIVAYRRNSRYYPVAEQMYAPNNSDDNLINDGDRILIIGGMGNVGLSIAQGLSAVKNVEFILTSTRNLAVGNSSISIEKEKYISEIEKNSSSVHIKKCDVNGDMSAFMDSLISEFGKINHIIFSAGIIGDNTFALIKDTTKEICDIQFDVKIKGLENVANIIKNYDVDNFIVISSVSSILGGIGHAAYSVSNMFIDFFVRKQNKTGNINWLSIDWDFWQFDTVKDNKYVGTTAVNLAISREEGMKLVPMIFKLCCEEQIIVSTGNLQRRYEDWVNIEKKNELVNDVEFSRPDLPNEYVAPSGELEEQIVEIWEQILGYKGIGVEDNFFELGGDSLKEVALSIEMKKKLNLEVSLIDFFEHPYIKDIALFTHKAKGSEVQESSPFQEFYPVSLEQQRMYMLYMADKKSLAYNTSLCMEIDGKLDVKKLEEAFINIINRNEILLSNYFMNDNDIVYKINRNKDFKLNVCFLSPNDVEKYISDFIRPYDLEKDFLIRAGVATIGDEKHVIIIDLHHIVADGISVELIKQELINFYFNNNDTGKKNKQYIDYIRWQRKNIYNGNFIEMGKYWANQFAEAEIPKIQWPVENFCSLFGERNGNNKLFTIDDSLYEKIRNLSKKKNVTVYMILMAVYNVLLHKLTSQKEFIVGMPISCRDSEQFDDVVGLMINTLPIKNILDGDMKFDSFLNSVCRGCLEAYENKSYPYEKIVENIPGLNNQGDNSLYDTILVMQNMKNAKFDYKGWSIYNHEINKKSTKTALSFEFTENNGSLQCRVEYDEDMFTDKILNRFIKGFTSIFKSVCDCPEVMIKDIDIFNDELPLLLRNEMYINYDYDENYTVVDMLNEKFVSSAENDAIYSDNVILSYRELDNITNYVADKLVKKFCCNDTVDVIAGILCDRTYEMIVLIIAYWKAGIAYTPFDNLIPVERFKFIISDSDSVAVVCSDNYFDFGKKCCEGRCKCLNYSSLVDEYDKNVCYNKINRCVPERSAYVIYTSGTTGTPKGVLIRHKNIVNSVVWRRHEFVFNENDRILQMFSFMFDGFVLSFLQPLISGSVLHVISNEKANDIPYISKYLAEQKITYICTVPQFFGAIIDCMNAEDMKYLRIVSLAGDKLKKEIIDNAKKKNPNLEICNEYGPTEASVVVSCHRNVSGENCNILGKPIFNTHLLVLDEYLKLSNINVAGQLCVSGKGIASGYLNMPELSREKFVPSPYFENEIMYLTGDIVRINEDGDIEFIGRKDSQVKIHGYRIEINEIVKALSEINEIKDVAVVARDDGNDKYLCVFYVSGRELELFELKQHLYKRLPAYMVPSHFVKLDSLPITPIGKIDEKSLKTLPISTYENRTVEYVPPTNDIEKELVEIWKKLFKSDNIGIDTNFFDMGGNSLNIVKMYSEITQRYSVELTITLMYKYPTVRMLAEYINNLLLGKTVSSLYENELNESSETFDEIMNLFGEDNFE